MKIRMPLAPSAGFGDRSKVGRTVEVKYLNLTSGSVAGEEEGEDDRQENVCFTPLPIVAMAPSIYVAVNLALADTLSMCELNILFMSGVR